MLRGLRTCSSSWMPWQTHYLLRPLLVRLCIAACSACVSAAVSRSVAGDIFRYALFCCRLLGVCGTGNGPGVGGFCGESSVQPLCYAAVDQFSHQQR